MKIPAQVDIVRGVRDLLLTEIPTDVDSAFIYGSVAAGSTHGGSDIDSLVVTKHQLEPQLITRLRQRFCEVQAELGFVADQEYPVEIFAEGHCWAALHGPDLASGLQNLAQRGDAETFIDSDDAEVLRALLGRNLVVLSSPTLSALAAAARQALHKHADEPRLVARLLGVRYLAEFVTEEAH